MSKFSLFYGVRSIKLIIPKILSQVPSNRTERARGEFYQSTSSRKDQHHSLVRIMTDHPIPILIGVSRVSFRPVINSPRFYGLFGEIKKQFERQEITHATASIFLRTAKTLMAKLKVK